MAWPLALTALLSGCGFLNAMANPPATTGVPSGSPASSSSPAAAPVTADLVGSADGRRASLTVSLAAVQRGVPPVQTFSGLLPQDCRLDPAATEYATASLVFTDRSQPTKLRGDSSNLRLDVTAAGHRGLGVIAVYAAATDYCHGTTAMPSQTIVQSQDLSGEHQTLTVYVVARTSPADPHPLQNVTLQLRDPRHRADDIDDRPWTWALQRVTGGSACPGAPNSLCLPLR
ncbi:MAG: hypothetical protein ACXVXS_12805 [Blastococcus sp.]